MTLEGARAVASAARERRASLVRALASGELVPTDLDSDERAGDVKAVVIAESLPGVGKVRARRALDAIGVPGSTPWRALPSAQRHELVEVLTTDGGRPATLP